MNTPYTSDELFHFVGFNSAADDEGNYRKLLKILHDGWVSYWPHNQDWGEVSVTTNWDGFLQREELIVPSVTCFADIPYGSLGIHTTKYGKFGISFSRDYLIKYGARPVMYVPLRSDNWGSPHGTTLLKNLEAIYKSFHNLLIKELPHTPHESRSLGAYPDNKEAAISAMGNVFAKDFLAFIKPFNSHLATDHEKNYYMEREWRKYGNLRCNLEDINQIWVAKGYAAKLAQEFPDYASKTKELV